jgi:hypothetical protein
MFFMLTVVNYFALAKPVDAQVGTKKAFSDLKAFLGNGYDTRIDRLPVQFLNCQDMTTFGETRISSRMVRHWRCFSRIVAHETTVTQVDFASQLSQLSQLVSSALNFKRCRKWVDDT